MRCLIIFPAVIAFFIIPFHSFAQSTFSFQEYSSFLESNRNLTREDLLPRHAPKTTYYSGRQESTIPERFSYLDSVAMKYNLTGPELDLLENNQFVVTERLSFGCFGRALHDVYDKDLPVFVTTDAVLHALYGLRRLDNAAGRS